MDVSTAPSVRAILREMNKRADRSRLPGMQRYGIDTSKAIGLAIPELRGFAKAIGRTHELAVDLWETEVHEARILASMIDDPAAVTEDQMDSWAQDFDSWDVCDQVCANLFERTRFAFRKAVEWSAADEEYVKRAAFVLMARSAVRNKEAADRLNISPRTVETHRKHLMDKLDIHTVAGLTQYALAKGLVVKA